MLWTISKSREESTKNFSSRSKERKLLKTTFQLLQGELPYKDDFSPKEVEVLVGK